MKRIYILSTCDDWKSRGSMIRYYVGSSDKAGTRRLLAAITKGIREHLSAGLRMARKFRYWSRLKTFRTT